MTSFRPSYLRPAVSARALALLIAFASCGSASAVDLRFEKSSDLERNFEEVYGKGALSWTKEDGGILRFASGDRSRLVRTAYSPRRKPEMLLDDSVAAEFRVKEPNASFGLMRRVTEDASDCYVALVNVGPKGGILRLFKGQPLSSYSRDHLTIAQSPEIKAGEWYRLEFSASNRPKGVLLKGELKPHTGGRAILSFEYEDQVSPLIKPGQVQLRFFAAEGGNQIDVKQVTIKPDKK